MYVTIKTQKREGFDNMNIKWIFMDHYACNGIVVDEYISEDGRWCKQFWSDGYSEIFELAY